VTAPDPHVVDRDHLPTPFSAAEIRDATPPGRSLVVRVDVAGRPSSTRLTRFAEVDEDGALQERSPLGPDGEPTEEPTATRVTWRSLQEHALFPVERSTRDRVRLAHPLGELDCIRYTVTDGDAVDVYWFDIARPGMPVLVDSRRGGTPVVTMTVLADEVRPS
jgi:hypothetical protein